jgi:peptide/nickel transport system ATP-binding protein
MSLLEVRGLEVFFDLPHGELHAIQGVDFALDAGERLGVVGESGAGKSSMILAMMGLLPPNASVAGRVFLDGQDLLSGGERGCDSWRWRQIATVFQGAMNAFNPVRTIGWQIAEPMQAHGTATGAMAKARARELLSLTGLPPGTERAYPHELSGGMRQRAAIAMALACQPKVLLADEPTTALDVIVQDGILKMLTELTDELGLALILVTHDLAAATATCTRLAVMYAGRIVEEAPVRDISAAPEHPYTRQLFAATPSLRGGEAVKAIPGVPPRLDVPIAGCPFAPRCEVSFERCHDERPALTAIAGGWRSACHRSALGSGAGDHGSLGSVGGLEIAAADAHTATALAPVSLTREAPQVLALQARPGGTPQGFGPALRLDRVFVSFPRRRSAAALMRGQPRPLVRAVDGLSLSVASGELVALVGESGSGKTSTANSIVGNARLTAGDILIAGHRVAEMDRRQRRLTHRQVQLVYQDPYESLDPRKRVRSILDEPLRVNKIGRGRAERRQLAESALIQVGLDPPELYTSRYPHELSGGQRQRVAIAAALVMNPSIIIADEPVSMLDVSIRAEVLDVFDDLRRTLSVAVVMITHDLSIAAHYADRIAVMYLGRIVELGPASEVIKSPRHPYTKALIAAVPSASPDGGRDSVLPGEIPDGAAIPPGCRFHPRCPVALASCSYRDPDFVTVSSGHSAACVLAT